MDLPEMFAVGFAFFLLPSDEARAAVEAPRTLSASASSAGAAFP